MQELRKMLEGHAYAERSGSVFYSQESALKPGPYYFLGLNPGGAPNPNDESEWLKHNHFPDTNAFYEAWPPYEAGRAPLQVRVKAFLASLEFPDWANGESLPDGPGTEQERFIKSVCSANLCFLRSKSVKDLEKPVGDCIDWDIQRHIINKIVRPSIIIVNGKQGYALLKAQLLGLSEAETIPTGNYGSGRARPGVEFARFDDDKLLVGIPHLSRGCHAACASAGNEVWKEAGLPKLRSLCEEVKERRKGAGPAWRFR